MIGRTTLREHCFSLYASTKIKPFPWRGFKGHFTIPPAVRFNYCPNCDAARVKSIIERDRCQVCGSRTVVVKVRQSWEYLAVSGMLIVGAALLMLLNLKDIILRLFIFLMFFVVAAYLATRGSERIRRKALSIGRDLSGEGEEE